MPQVRSDQWVLLGVSVLLLAAATVTRADPDLWGHLRFGLDTLHAWRLTSVDPYSFTQDIPWINHEWLSEVQMAGAWSLGGAAGLAALKGVILFAAGILLWPSLVSLSVWQKTAALLLVVIGTIHMWAFMRPQLWTLLCFAILCRVLVASRPRPLLLAIVFAFWANCHGGWVVGLGVLGARVTAAIVLAERNRRLWLATAVLCVAVTLLNPYGWRLWAFMLQTVRPSRSIAEWQPLWTTPWLNWIPWIAGVIGIAATAVRRDRAGRSPAMVLGPLAYGALRVQRIESLFVVACLVLLSPYVPKPEVRSSSGSAPTAEWLGASLALVCFAFASVIGFSSLRCIPIAGDWAPDNVASTALASAPPGRLVTSFDWGEYAIWHFGPRLKVSMDGRRETVYSDARLDEYEAILEGQPDGLLALANWRPEYAWLPLRSRRTRDWLATHGYRIEVEGPRSFLAVRADLPHLTQAPRSPADCFPG